MNDRFELSDGSPNDVACPYCGMPAGDPCRKISGKLAAFPHSMRWQVWRGRVYYQPRHRDWFSSGHAADTGRRDE